MPRRSRPRRRRRPGRPVSAFPTPFETTAGSRWLIPSRSANECASRRDGSVKMSAAAISRSVSRRKPRNRRAGPAYRSTSGSRPPAPATTRTNRVPRCRTSTAALTAVRGSLSSSSVPRNNATTSSSATPSSARTSGRTRGPTGGGSSMPFGTTISRLAATGSTSSASSLSSGRDEQAIREARRATSRTATCTARSRRPPHVRRRRHSPQVLTTDGRCRRRGRTSSAAASPTTWTTSQRRIILAICGHLVGSERSASRGSAEALSHARSWW